MFTAGAALEAGGVRSHKRENPGLSFIFDGGSHALGSTAYAGDVGSCSLAWTDVVVSNSAVLAAQDVLSIRSASTITVCEGGSLSTLKTAKVGHHAWQEAAQFGDCALVLNNGTASCIRFAFSGHSFGSMPRAFASSTAIQMGSQAFES